jgi:hypothetical protein
MNCNYRNEKQSMPAPGRPAFPGLIDGMDDFAAALHGFEVTLDGRVVIPELCPKSIGRWTAELAICSIKVGVE